MATGLAGKGSKGDFERGVERLSDLLADQVAGFVVGQRGEIGDVDGGAGQPHFGFQPALRGDVREVVGPKEGARVFAGVGATEEDKFSHANRIDHVTGFCKLWIRRVQCPQVLLEGAH